MPTWRCITLKNAAILCTRAGVKQVERRQSRIRWHNARQLDLSRKKFWRPLSDPCPCLPPFTSLGSAVGSSSPRRIASWGREHRQMTPPAWPGHPVGARERSAFVPAQGSMDSTAVVVRHRAGGRRHEPVAPPFKRTLYRDCPGHLHTQSCLAIASTNCQRSTWLPSVLAGPLGRHSTPSEVRRH